MKHKITEKRLREIIAEELRLQNEGLDAEAVAKVVGAASDATKALNKFKENMNGALTSAVHPHLEQLLSILEKVMTSPGTYIDVVKPEPKTVRLRAVKDEK